MWGWGCSKIPKNRYELTSKWVWDNQKRKKRSTRGLKKLIPPPANIDASSMFNRATAADGTNVLANIKVLHWTKSKESWWKKTTRRVIRTEINLSGSRCLNVCCTPSRQHSLFMTADAATMWRGPNSYLETPHSMIAAPKISRASKTWLRSWTPDKVHNN